MVSSGEPRYNGSMQTRSWITLGLALSLALVTAAEAAPNGKATVRKVGGVNEYTYTGPKKKKAVKAETPAPSLTLAEGQAPPTEPAPPATGPRPTTTAYDPGATAPAGQTYTQEHVPTNPAARRTSYSQTYSPGPNTGKADNGFMVPGGASILSSGPIFYPFPYAGGGGWGGGGWGPGPIQLAPNGRGCNNGYGYNGYGYNGYGYGNGFNNCGNRGNSNCGQQPVDCGGQRPAPPVAPRPPVVQQPPPPQPLQHSVQASGSWR